MQIRGIRLRRPSPAMVVACVALTVALAGTSYATVSTLGAGIVGTKQLKNNAVTSQKLKNNAVTSQKLKNNAVTSEKVRNFSLRAWDFRQGELPHGSRGPQGPPGPAGPAGPSGPQGAPGVVGDLELRTASVSVPGNVAGNGLYLTKSVEVACPSGSKAISGGTSWSDDSDDLELMTVYSRPVLENTRAVGWRAKGGSDLATDRIFTVQVLCAKA